MQVVYERCCGIDVHKKMVVACVLTDQRKAVRTFGTMTGDLLALADWISQERCQMVAMESTGVYWKPIYNVLEAAGLPLLVVNAKHMKATTGDYSHWKHGCLAGNRRGHRCNPSPLRPALSAA